MFGVRKIDADDRAMLGTDGGPLYSYKNYAIGTLQLVYRSDDSVLRGKVISFRVLFVDAGQGINKW